ncbi:MAG: hypothetical protein Q4F69_09845, partial [Bacteroidia bacterium]|nr:hypothetical protein [Bacteroidia bacterium]
MKKSFALIIGVLALLASCSSSSSLVNDDAYYSPYDKTTTMSGTLVTSNGGNFGSSTIRENKNYDYSEYYPEDKSNSGGETVYIIEENKPKTTFTIEFGVGVGWPYYGWGWPYYGPYYGPYYMPSWYFGWSYDPWYGTYWHWNYWKPWGPAHPWYPCCCCHPVVYQNVYNYAWDRPHSNHNNVHNYGSISSGRSKYVSSGLQVANNARASRSARDAAQTDVRTGRTGSSSASVAAGSRTSSTRPTSTGTSTRPTTT